MGQVSDIHCYRPTVCVRGAWRWAGVDGALAPQEKLKARKMSENAQTPTSRPHAVSGGFDELKPMLITVPTQQYDGKCI